MCACAWGDVGGCMCMSVCMYVGGLGCGYECVEAVGVCVYVRGGVCVCVCVQVCVYACVQVCVWVYVCGCVQVCVCMCVGVYGCGCVQVWGVCRGVCVWRTWSTDLAPQTPGAEGPCVHFAAPRQAQNLMGGRRLETRRAGAAVQVQRPAAGTAPSLRGGRPFVQFRPSADG